MNSIKKKYLFSIYVNFFFTEEEQGNPEKAHS